MTTPVPLRRARRALSAALVLGTAFAVAACGSGGDDSVAAPESAGPAGVPRVVDLLDTTVDLARMGVPVVGHSYLDQAFLESQLVEIELPTDIAADVRAATPVNPGDGISTEIVASLDPDIILLSQTSVDTFRADPAALAEFADVVMLPEDLSWQDRTRRIGAAVGRETEADDLVGQAEQAVTDLAGAVTQAGVQGATVSPMRLDVPNFGALAFIPPSIASTVIADSGLAQPSVQVDDPPPYPGVAAYYALTEIPIERLPEADADVILALARGGSGATNAVDGNPLWQSMPAVRDGRVVEVPYLLWALNSATGVQQITDDLTEVLPMLAQRP